MSSLAPIPRWLGVSLLLLIAVIFGSNHIAARIALDHGANVMTAVAFRSLGTAMFLLALLRVSGVSFRLPGGTFKRGLVVGLVIAAQSYCIYSAVARIPVALALLVFNTFPIVLALISWAAGGDRPVRRVLVAMPIALAGLALALDVGGWSAAGKGGFAGRWTEMGSGVLFAFGASFLFGAALFLTTRWLHRVDGRMRSLLTMATVGVVTLAVGAMTDGFVFPRDDAGWLGLWLLTLFYGTAFTSLFVLLPRMGAVNNAAIINFEPVAVLFLGWLILGQSIGPTQIFGAFVVIGAIVMIATARR